MLYPEGIHLKSPEHSRSISAGKFVEFFSGAFRSVSGAFRQKPVGNHREKTSQILPVRILQPCSSDFRCISSRTVPYSLI